jgi:hypothetical protein
MGNGDQMVGVYGNQQGYATGFHMGNQNMQNAGQYAGNQYGQYAGNQYGQHAGNQMGQFIGNQRGQNVGNQAMGNQNRNVAAPVVGNQGNVNQGNPVKCFNCQGVGHMARNKKDLEYL